MPTDNDLDIDLQFLRSSAREFLAGRGEKDSVEDLARMDWTGLLVGESLGGAGWRPVEAAVVAEEIGRAGDRSAWLGTTVAAAVLATAPDGVRQRLLPQLLDGTAAAGVAVASDHTNQVRVIRADSCAYLVVLGGSGVQLIEDAAALPRDEDPDLLDVNRPSYRVDISEARLLELGPPERATEMRGVARLLISADTVGAISGTFERLIGYLRDRVAFGAPIASFQAVQHRLVELLVLQVKARAIVMKAMRAVAAGDPQSTLLAATAHAFVTDKATAAVDECMQLSGGIGFTWEYPLHHELRRVFDNAQLFGTARASRTELAEMAGW